METKYSLDVSKHLAVFLFSYQVEAEQRMKENLHKVIFIKHCDNVLKNLH